MKYLHILQAVTGTPWAILPEKMAVIRDLLAFRMAGGELTAEEIKERMGTDVKARARHDGHISAGGAIAVLPMLGTIIPRANLIRESSGAVSMQRFKASFREAVNNEDVSAIVIDVDSPGGQVGGVEEMAQEIYNARGTKPITAVANGLAASAAYWVATAADELVVTPSGQVGSIGVFAMHEDVSEALEKEGIKVSLISAGKYKTEGNPFEPLTEEALAAMQKSIDEYYTMFTEAVARHRGVSGEAVRSGFGEGRVVSAETAVQLGMADRVATFDDVIRDLQATSPSKGKAWADKEYRQRRSRALSR